MILQIWHNAACSSSNKVKEALVHSFGSVLEVREYLKYPPTEDEIKEVLSMMNQTPTYILRKKDKVFKEMFEGKELSDEEWIKAMSHHPSIIERPIVIANGKSYLARPSQEFIDSVLPKMMV
jgi:arsenate reductase